MHGVKTSFKAFISQLAKLLSVEGEALKFLVIFMITYLKQFEKEPCKISSTFSYCSCFKESRNNESRLVVLKSTFNRWYVVYDRVWIFWPRSGPGRPARYRPQQKYLNCFNLVNLQNGSFFSGFQFISNFFKIVCFAF